MTADVVIRAGPFFGINAEPEVELLRIEMERLGFPLIRAHRHGAWIIVEGWKVQPESMQDEPMPSTEFVRALVAGEIPDWCSADGYALPERKVAPEPKPALPQQTSPHAAMPRRDRRTVSETEV